VVVQHDQVALADDAADVERQLRRRREPLRDELLEDVDLRRAEVAVTGSRSMNAVVKKSSTSWSCGFLLLWTWCS